MKVCFALMQRFSQRIALRMILILFLSTAVTSGAVNGESQSNPVAGTWQYYSSNSTITAIDANAEYVWIGMGDGVLRWDRNEQTYTRYTTLDGLGSNEISSIEMDAAGNVWFGGLVERADRAITKFDGTSWTYYEVDPAIQAEVSASGPRVDDIKSDGAGNVWVVMGFTNKLYQFDGVNWRTYTYDDGNDETPDVHFRRLEPDNQGNIWLSTYSEGAVKFDGSHWTSYRAIDGLISDEVLDIAADSIGGIWFGTRWGISKFDGKSWTSYTQTSAGNGISASEIEVAPDDSVWAHNPYIYYTNLVPPIWIYRFDGTNWTTWTNYSNRTFCDSGHHSISGFVSDDLGDLWTGMYFRTNVPGGTMLSPTHLCHYDGSAWTSYPLPTEEFPFTYFSNYAGYTLVSSDSKGAFWGLSQLYSGQFALAKFSGGGWLTYPMDIYQPPNYQYPNSLILDPKDIAWVVARGSVYKFDGSQWTAVPRDMGIWIGGALGADNLGNLWFFGNTEMSVSVRFDGNHWTSYSETDMFGDDDGDPYDSLLMVDSQRNVWAIRKLQIAAFRNNAWEVIGELDQGVSIRSLDSDRQGNLWVSPVLPYLEDVLYRFDGTTWTQYTMQEDLDVVDFLALDTWDNIWVVGRGGGGGRKTIVQRFDGSSWKTFAPEDGLVNLSVNQIVPDPTGGVWLAHSEQTAETSGVSHFNGERWTFYASSNGPITAFGSNGNNPLITPGVQGEVWVIGNRGGISRFIPEGTTLAYSISGRVTYRDSYGVAPVEGALVSTAGHSTQTDTYGRYVLTDLIPGTYTLSISGKGLSFTPSQRQVTVPSSTNSYSFAVQRRPLIFIPGAGGSTLLAADGKTELWPAPYQYWRHSRLTEEGIIAGDAIREPVPFQPIYKPLLDMLIEGGYNEYVVGNQPLRRTSAGCDVTGQQDNHPTLFVFAYDWRHSIEANAALLKEYVECIQQFYPDTKVDVIAHSMGGLVARRYIIQYGGQETVAKLITLGTPWLGSPDTLKVMLTGDFLKYFATRPDTIKELVVHFDGTHQLLPSQFYFDVTGLTVLQEKGVDLNNNGQDDTYTSLDSLRPVFQTLGYPTDPVTMNNQFFTPEQLNWNGVGQDIESHIIVSQQMGNTTLAGLKVSQEPLCDRFGPSPECESLPRYRPAKKVVGDETVPLDSLRGIQNGSINITIHTLTSSSVNENPQYSHLGLLANPLTHSLIKNILGAETDTTTVAQTTREEDSLEEFVPLRYITLWQVDALTITHPLSGTVSTTDNTIFFSTLPGVTVHGLGERSYLVIVPPTEPFEILIASNTPHLVEIVEGDGNEEITGVARYRDLSALQDSAQEILTVGPEQLGQLGRDDDKDGVVDAVIPPSGVAAGDAAKDITPPTLTIDAVPGDDQGKDLITITAIDAGSGIQSVDYSLDGNQFTGYTAPFVAVAGSAVYAFADDVVGNRSQEVVYQVPSGQNGQGLFLPVVRR